MSKQQPLAVSIKKAGEMLGVGYSLTRKLVKQGAIPAIRLGEKRLVVPVAALEELIRAEATKQKASGPERR